RSTSSQAVPRLDPGVQTPETVAMMTLTRDLVHQTATKPIRRVTSSDASALWAAAQRLTAPFSRTWSGPLGELVLGVVVPEHRHHLPAVPRQGAQHVRAQGSPAAVLDRNRPVPDAPDGDDPGPFRAGVVGLADHADVPLGGPEPAQHLTLVQPA